MYDTPALSFALSADKFSHELLGLSHRFTVLDDLTEQAFLKIGSEIDECYQRSRGIVGLAEETLLFLDSGRNGETLLRLQLLVERGSLWLNEAHDQAEMIGGNLNALARDLTALQQPVFGLSKALKVLHALRLSTKIEASRRGGQDAVVLGEELLKLARMVQDKLNDIQKRTEFLDQLCRRALSQGESDQTGPLAEALRQIGQARQDTVAAVAHRGTSAQQALSVNQQSLDIANRFGELVVALQFQDITRQRLGHIRVALCELAECLPEAPDSLSLLARVGRLQEQQLTLAVEEFLCASDRLVDNLSGMRGHVVALEKLTETAVQSKELELTGQLSTDISQVTACLETVLNRHRASGQAIFAICQSVHDVATMTSDIELLGEEMQLLAQNAAISAARSCGRAAGLDVIAENIQRLAQNAGDHTETLAGRCVQIVGRADGLDALDHDCGCREADLGQMLREGSELVDCLSQCVGGLAERVAEIIAQTEGLGAKVCQSLQGFTVREQFLVRVADLRRELRVIVAAAEKVTGGVVVPDGNELLADLQGLYTMKSERDVHNLYFQAREDQTETASTGPFGANVELF